MTVSDARPDVFCVILAGGGSRRFAKPKGLAQLGGKTLIAHIAARLQLQTQGPVVLNADPNGVY
ncbi:MAG: NTP transferase domain-containing protein, partial [Pseudomonadota bacterium]